MKTKEIIISIVVVLSVIFTGYGAVKVYNFVTDLRDAQIEKLNNIG